MEIEKLSETLRLHKLWLAEKDGGVRAVLRGADLSDADLRGAVLSRADLSGAVLSRAVLSGAYLSGAALDGATLQDTRF